MTIEVAVARQVDRLERAAEDVVVGDRDRAEPLRLGVVDELGRVDRAVERPRGVHVQVGDDPRPVGERVGRRGAARGGASCSDVVELVELGGDVGERAPAPRLARALLLRRAQRVVLGEPRDGRAGELGLRPRRRSARRSRSRRPAPRAARARARPDPGHEDRGLVQQRRARGAVARGAHVDARRRGRAGSRAARRAASSAAAPPPSPGSSRSARSTLRATARSFGRSSTTISVPLRRRARRASRSTPGETTPVVAGEALGRRVARRLREREQRVEPAEQLLALRARRRVREPVGRARTSRR